MSSIKSAAFKIVFVLFAKILVGTVDPLIAADSLLHDEQFEIWIGDPPEPKKQESKAGKEQQETQLDVCPCEESEPLPADDSTASTESMLEEEEVLEECDCQEEEPTPPCVLEEEMVECCEEEEEAASAEEVDVWECEEQEIFEEEILEECDCQDIEPILPKSIRKNGALNPGPVKQNETLEECDCEEMGGVLLEDWLPQREANQAVETGQYEEIIREDLFEETLPVFREGPVPPEPEYYWTRSPPHLEKKEDNATGFVSEKQLQECPCREAEMPIRSVFSAPKKREKIAVPAEIEAECPCFQEEERFEPEILVEVVECPEEPEEADSAEVDVWECEEVEIVDELEEQCPCIQEERLIEPEIFVEVVECPEETEPMAPDETDVWECEEEEIPVKTEEELCPCQIETASLDKALLP